ncbi:MAG TPA: YdiU family protein [Chthoniobacterales bacterium]|nr:YdiU family protein [Chthoniobacterales bacterium]
MSFDDLCRRDRPNGNRKKRDRPNPIRLNQPADPRPRAIAPGDLHRTDFAAGALVSPPERVWIRVAPALAAKPSTASEIPFDNSYARLPEGFFARVAPTPVRAPRLIRVNRELALELGIDPDWLASTDGVQVLAGNRVPENAEPIAMAYAGHQFGVFVPQLGDGRAILLGEVVDRSGLRRDIHLKGSGRTPFSRGGDGRAWVGPVLREYVVSEAMAALGIPTTRALAAVTTGEEVMRETVLPGAVLTRVAASHVRVGTFQFFASRGDDEAVRILADHVIARHYREAAQAERPYRALLDAVIRAQAELIAQWLLVGFIHGVMNTDNMSIAGETIDYGPCAFMDEYDPRTVFSSIDRFGRYAYANQPNIALWNLTAFAQCLLSLLAEDEDHAIADGEEALAAFAPAFQNAYQAGLRRKVGFITEQPGDAALGQDLLNFMHDHRADFTNTFRRLSDAAAGDESGFRALFGNDAEVSDWLSRWQQRLEQDPAEKSARAASMRAVNPAFIPRNHRVEAMISAAVEKEDFRPFEELLSVLAKPFEAQPAFDHYTAPPEEHERVQATFCGT